MCEWIEDWKNNPPPEGVLVECRGDWVGGDFTYLGKRKDYKKGSTKAQLKRVWRWVDENNEVVSFKDRPNAYRLIKA